MAGWTIDTLPPGYTVAHTVRSADGTAPGACLEWYTIQGYGAVSDRLCVDSPTFQTDLDAFVDATLPPPAPPGAADLVLGALASLDPATASVADVVDAVKGALAASGASAVATSGQPIVAPIAGP